MRLWKLGVLGVAAASVAALAASMHGSKPLESGDRAETSVVRGGSPAPPRPGAPAVAEKSETVEAKAAEPLKAAPSAPAERKPEPGAQAYAILPDGTRYYWVPGAQRDAHGNWVPHVFHVAAQPIERDVDEPMPGPTAGSTARSTGGNPH